MRQHIEHLLAALGALGLALFISYFNTTGPLVPVSAVSSLGQHGVPSLVATSTFPDIKIPSTTYSNPTTSVAVLTPKPPRFESTATQEPYLVPRTQKPPQPKKVPMVATSTPRATITAPVAVTPTPEPKSSDTRSPLLSHLSDSIVNILCISQNGSVRSTSGSGVIIDSRGIILTVAHVAQSTLLESYLGSNSVSCAIRTGNPARVAYRAVPVYVSQPWVQKNSTTLISSHPSGTGENDFALLAIIGTANGGPLPGSFPFVPLAHDEASAGDTVGIGSYGAQFLTGLQVRNALAPTLVMNSVLERMTFSGHAIDVLSIAGSDASQEGSSGGAVVNTQGELVGLITTSANTGATSTREMRVITPGHIRRSFTTDTGKELEAYLGSSVSALVDGYAATAQTLGEFIAKAIGLH